MIYLFNEISKYKQIIGTDLVEVGNDAWDGNVGLFATSENEKFEFWKLKSRTLVIVRYTVAMHRVLFLVCIYMSILKPHRDLLLFSFVLFTNCVLFVVTCFGSFQGTLVYSF